MNIAVGDRVRALDDCRMAGRGTSRYFYRAGDTGAVVRFDGLGAWVKWDGNRIDDGVWYASTEVLALIEEDTSGVDVLAVMEEAEANTYSALSDRIRDARAAVAKLMEPASVDGAMVERMAQAVATELYGEPPPPGSNSLTRAMMLPCIKRALTAALTTQQGGKVT